MNNKKILIISYLFPPIGGGGVIRVTKFTKYLKNFGWDPLVLTVKNGFYPLIDKSLLKELSKKIKIFRVQYFEPGLWIKNRWWQSFLNYIIYRWLFIPDERVLWLMPAVKKALEIVKKEDLKIIMTTSSPATDHLVGLIVKKMTGIKWIADFRDEWANNPLRKFPTPLHKLMARFLEKKVVENADWVISVSEPINQYLKSLSNQKKFSVITNGYDEEDFQNLKLSKSKIFRLVHVGSLYSLKYQESFIQSFQDLKLKNARLTFIGSKMRLPHKQAVKKMINADVLLLILDPIERTAVLTGKLFEYLRAQRPILALADRNSEAAKMIVKYQVGEVVEPTQEAFKKEVLIMYQKWLTSRRSGPASPSQGGQKNQLKIPEVNIEKYTRKNLTKKLINKLEKLIKIQKKIKLCLIGNIQSPQNQNLCLFFLKKDYDIHFITTHPGKIMGIKVYYLNRWSKESTPFYFIRSLLRIRKIINLNKPDIVHGQDLVFSGIWAYLSGFRPYAVTPWGSDVMNYNKFIRLEKYLIKKSLQESDLVTVSSEALREQAEMIGLGENKTQLIHFGIDLDIFRKKNSSMNLKRKLKFKNEKIIFCPRAIAPIYNIDILIHSFKKISQKLNLKLVLMATTVNENYFSMIKEIIDKEKLNGKIFFFRKISVSEMIDLYNLADVVVTLTSSDGCSVSFLEAMACEKKIVATDLPYIKEWRDSNNLWIVPVRNISKTAKGILDALNIPFTSWSKIGQANRQMVKERAEIQNNVNKLDKLYRELI